MRDRILSVSTLPATLYSKLKLLLSPAAPAQVADAARLSKPFPHNKLQEKSHFRSLRDQLRFLIKPDLRRNYESYISQQATASNYQSLVPSSWQEIPIDLISWCR